MIRRTSRQQEDGFILVNVLAIVAIASAVVVTMMLVGDIGIRRSQRFGDAAQALAWSMGAETSAAVALRRDGEQAPQVDHFGEQWAKLAQNQVSINQGIFTLAISDAQSRFNVNSLQSGGTVAMATFRNICTALNFAPDIADRVSVFMGLMGKIDEISQLRAAGLDDVTIDALATMAIALPEKTDVNINTAKESLIAVLLGNPVAAHFLVSRRDRAGFLSKNDLAATGLLLPAGTGLTSNYFVVTTRVTVGDTSQTLTSLLERRKRSGQVEVVAISRKIGGAAPLPEPPR